jgi:ABC-type branched-subunit amino acid transport system permease subunit
MSGIRIFNVHRPWEDWVSMLLGVLIGFSPWFAGQQDNPAINWNAVLVGVLVLAFAELEYISLQRWEEAGEMVLGFWLMASPFTFGYAETGTLRYWHFLFGAMVVVLAILELWQDWRLSDKELARHGQ